MTKSLNIGVLQEVVRELGSFKGPPWVPDPPLVFGTSDMQFIKVPVHTGQLSRPN